MNNSWHLDLFSSRLVFHSTLSQAYTLLNIKRYMVKISKNFSNSNGWYPAKPWLIGTTGSYLVAISFLWIHDLIWCWVTLFSLFYHLSSGNFHPAITFVVEGNRGDFSYLHLTIEFKIVWLAHRQTGLCSGSSLAWFLAGFWHHIPLVQWSLPLSQSELSFFSLVDCLSAQ